MNLQEKTALLVTSISLMAPPAFALDPSAVLRNPLITGASVSADRGTPSPGRRLSLRYTGPENIHTIAYGGRLGRETLKQVTEKTLVDRSAVLAIDLFFWDSALANVDESVASLRRLARQTAAKNIPLILGEIPELLPGRQPSLRRLNREINEACALNPRCRVVPFEGMLKKVLSDGGLEIGGRRYSIFELVPDGLHLAPVAGEYLADRMNELIVEIKD